jgi:hypothetical protein
VESIKILPENSVYLSFSNIKSIEIVVLEGESTNEKWTIFLGYQGKLIMVLTSAVRLG